MPIAEYTLKTRLQIVRTKGKELLRRWRRYVWEAGQESANRDALGLSAGVQCNGMPTYEAYCERTPDPLLFFDSRVTEDMLVDPQEQRAREKRLMAGGPLHLTYAGRLIEMKGPLHLLKVAHHLEKLQVPFHLSIAGGGDLEEELRRRIEAERLTGSVQMVGTLDFNRELMPMLRHSADLALFCHPQGDPSCAYLEAMAAGLPVVGYANEALASMCKLTSAGWSTPLNEPRALAERIAELHGDRLSLVRAGRAASDFAADNTFERTMDRRVDHLKAILASRAPQPVD